MSGPGPDAAALIAALEPGAALGVVVEDAAGRAVLISPSAAAVDGLPRRLAPLLAHVRDSGEPVARVEVEGGVASLHALGDHAAAVVALDGAEAETPEARLAAALRLARIGAFTLDVRTQRRTWSAEVYRQAGLDAARGPDPEAWLATIAAEDARRLDAALDRALEHGEPWEAVVRRVSDDGPDRFILNKGFAQRGRDGAITGLQGFTQDVTERRRAEEKQRAIADLGQVALAGLEPQELMQLAGDAVAAALELDVVGILEVDPEHADWVMVRAGHGRLTNHRDTRMPLDSPRYHVGQLVRTGEPVVIDDWETETRFDRPTRLMTGKIRSSVSVTIGRPPRPWGILSAHGRRPRQVGADDVAFLQAVANLLASALERIGAEEEIAALAAARGRLVAQALEAEDRTRREISGLLHDGPLQDLLALAEDIERLEARDDRGALHRERARAGVGRAVGQLRASMADLHPVIADVGGLEPAIAAVADQQARIGGFDVSLAIAPEAGGARDELVVALARELLVNAARHARAGSVGVTVRRDDGAVVLEVADDGAGIAPGRLGEALREGHIGLASSRERVEAIGGRLELRGGPGAGTTAIAVLPLP